jgi:hypothetical protein
VNGVLEAPIVVMDEGVIFDGTCKIKPKEHAASQTARVLSANAEKTEKPVEPSGKPQAQSGSPENKESGASAKN